MVLDIVCACRCKQALARFLCTFPTLFPRLYMLYLALLSPSGARLYPLCVFKVVLQLYLQYLLGGLSEIDVQDWKTHTQYDGYVSTDAVVQWFWKAVENYDEEMRARLLQFVTGTSKVPMNGFSELQGTQLEWNLVSQNTPCTLGFSKLGQVIMIVAISWVQQVGAGHYDCCYFLGSASWGGHYDCCYFFAVGSQGPRRFCLKKYGTPNSLPRAHTWCVHCHTYSALIP
jgi:hypothetical protein